MSSQFKIQKKHDIEWEQKYYFSSSTLDDVINFLLKYDKGYQFQSPNDPNGFGLEGCEMYIIDDDLLKSILSKLESGEITEEDIPRRIDKEELKDFIVACIHHAKNTGGYAYVDVF